MSDLVYRVARGICSDNTIVIIFDPVGSGIDHKADAVTLLNVLGHLPSKTYDTLYQAMGGDGGDGEIKSLAKRLLRELEE